MAHPRFFVETLSSDAVHGGTVRLPDAEAKHAQGSRRLSVDDDVIVFDGQGHWAAGRITCVSSRVVDVAIGPVVFQDRPTPTLTLALALPKGPRQDTLIEKCTELGVAAIWPIVAERSISDASGHKLGKWKRKTIEAAKQSGQCRLPELREPRRLADVLNKTSHFDEVWAATTESVSSPPIPILDRVSTAARPQSILTFIGPEGGWAADEIDMLMSAAAQPISLGPNILRIETAAIAVAAMVHALVEKMDPA